MKIWQPIETAPHDVEILVCYEIDPGDWKIEKAVWNDREGKFLNSTYDPFQDDVEDATHWMPLPEPPQSK